VNQRRAAGHFLSDAPAHKEGAPGEAGAEGGSQKQGTFFEAAVLAAFANATRNSGYIYLTPLVYSYGAHPLNLPLLKGKEEVSVSVKRPWGLLS
jgi:hypothetical protein